MSAYLDNWHATDEAAALRQHFGYAPDVHNGEKFVIHEGARMLVIHPDRRIKVFVQGARHDQDYYEIEPAR